MHIKKPIAVSLTIAVLNFDSGLAQAQPPATATAQAAPKQFVTPRALITQVEIAEYRRSIRTAPTHEAKMAIRDATYAKLRQRAAERGMVMSEPQPWYGGLHWGELMLQQAKQKQVVPATPEAAPVLPQKTAPALPQKTTPVLPQKVAPILPQKATPTLPQRTEPMLPHHFKPVLPRML